MPDPPNVITILNIPGTMLHKDSDEAKKQMSGEYLGNNGLSSFVLLTQLLLILKKILITFSEYFSIQWIVDINC